MKVLRPEALGKGVRLSALASYLPAKVVTNADLVLKGAPLTDEEMVRLTGVQERRYAADHEATSDLAIAVGRKALARAQLSPEEVDRLVVGTISPDHMSPSAACFVQRGLGL